MSPTVCLRLSFLSTLLCLFHSTVVLHLSSCLHIFTLFVLHSFIVCFLSLSFSVSPVLLYFVISVSLYIPLSFLNFPFQSLSLSLALSLSLLLSLSISL